jgi:hypothetical protein
VQHSSSPAGAAGGTPVCLHVSSPPDDCRVNSHLQKSVALGAHGVYRLLATLCLLA